MNFTHYNLGHVASGSVVVVTLQGNAANVRLMDSSNFSSFKAGRQHRYTGGLARQSPVRLAVPHAGNWHVVVDVNRRPKGTPYRRAKGTPFVEQRDGYDGRAVRAGCGVGRA